VFLCFFSAFVSVPSLLFLQSAIRQINRQRAERLKLSPNRHE
jgi:hypothetical protein